MPISVIILLVLAVVYIIYATNKENKKKIEEEEDKKGHKEFQKAIQIEVDKLKYILTGEINFSNCTKCDDVTFMLERFNSSYTSIEAKCVTCGKLVWFKSDGNKNSKLKEVSKYIEELCSTYYDTPLDISFLGLQISFKSTRTENEDTKRRSIPTKTKQEVWQRDGGKCVECGSNEKLEYDHIIPVSKGGANTVRNIQLLCEPCNRKKSAKIV